MYTHMHDVALIHVHMHDEGGRERAGSGRRGQFHICYEHELINAHTQTDGIKAKKSKKVRFCL